VPETEEALELSFDHPPRKEASEPTEGRVPLDLVDERRAAFGGFEAMDMMPLSKRAPHLGVLERHAPHHRPVKRFPGDSEGLFAELHDEALANAYAVGAFDDLDPLPGRRESFEGAGALMPAPEVGLWDFEIEA
jgi:hypothetical protein